MNKHNFIAATIVATIVASFFNSASAQHILAPAYSFLYDGVPVAGNDGLTTPDGKVRVTMDKKEYPDYGAVEWVLWFENISSGDSGTLSEIRDCDILMEFAEPGEKWRGHRSHKGEREVISMRGPVDNATYSFDDEESALEFSAQHHYFHPDAPETLNFACKGNRSSDGTVPLFDVTQDGSGFVMLLGWSGGWKAEFQNANLKAGEFSGVRARTGLSDACFYLKPGEKVRTSSVLIMPYDSSEDSGNKFRALLRDHINHKAGRENVRDGIFSFIFWGGLSSAEMQRRLNFLGETGLPFEDIWLDAGWSGYGKDCDDVFSGDWWKYNGDFNVNSRVHPEGLEPVRDAAAMNGMRMILWFEPERICPEAKFAAEHPGWLMKSSENEWNWMLNISDPQVSSYVEGILSDYIDRLNISCYRQDFNISPTFYFKAADEPGRTGIAEIRHITAMYAIWDKLLERFPDLIIDNCAAGGRRIDLETLKRSIPVFRSDYQCRFDASPEVVQAHNAGISRYFPFNGCTTKSSDEYALRSSFSSSYGVAYYSTIFQKKEEIDWDAAVRTASEYARIRPFLSKDFYNLGSATSDPTAWAVWQYSDPDTGEGALVAFRRSESPASEIQISLKGVPKGSKVLLTNLSDGSRPRKVSSDKIVISLPEKRSSVVLKYSLKK